MRKRPLQITTLLAFSTILCLAAANVALWAMNMGNIQIYRRDPDFGYVTMPDQWPSPRGIVFRINQAGLRGADFPEHKAPGTLRITFVGDSVTFAGGVVSDANTFVSLSAAELSRKSGRTIDTVNISSPGWSPLNMQRYIARYGLYGADVVAWVLPREDFYRPMFDGTDILTQKPMFRLQVFLTAALQRLESRWAEPKTARASGDEEPAAVSPGDPLEINLNAFSRVLSEARDRGIPVVVIFFPEGGKAADSNPKAYKAYTDAAHAASAQTCDVSPEMAANGGDALFYDGAHLNANGHIVSGRLIAACLARFAPSLFHAADTPQ